MPREITVDIAKGLGIVLVVVGHTIAAWESGHESLHRFIYSFHMPLFLGISGLYIAMAQPLATFIATKASRIIVPFAFWTLTYFIFEQTKNNLKVVKDPFLALLHLLDHDELAALSRVPLLANWQSLADAGVFVDLWFLPALFSMVVIVRLLAPATSQFHPSVLFILTTMASYGMTTFSSSQELRPFAVWGIDIAIAALPFLYIFRARHFIYSQHMLFLPVLIVIVWYFSRDTDVALATLSVSNYPHFFVSACAGITLILLLSKKLETTLLGTVLSRLGQRSYGIFVMSGMVAYLAGSLTKLPIFATGDIASTAKCTLTLVCTYYLYPLLRANGYLGMLALGEKKTERIGRGDRVST